MPILLSGGSGLIGPSDFSTVISSVTAQVNVGTIMSVIASIAAVCIGIVFAWWGLRKVVRMVMAAFKKGKLSV